MYKSGKLNIEYTLEKKPANKLRVPSLFQTLKFPKAFLTAPTIIVSAAHTKTSLTMPPEYNSIVTWVEVIISRITDFDNILLQSSFVHAIPLSK